MLSGRLEVIDDEYQQSGHSEARQRKLRAREPTASRVTGDTRSKTGALHDSARQSYLTEARRQLLEEVARDGNG
jgi:hypothetical protein